MNFKSFVSIVFFCFSFNSQAAENTCEFAKIVTPTNVCNLGIVGDALVNATSSKSCSCVASFNLEKLESLPLNNLQLKQIPSELFTAFEILPSLKAIDLSNNELTQMQIGFLKKKKTLEVVNFSGNKISSLGIGSFLQMDNLKVLDLSNNRLSKLPVGAFQGLNLESLDLSGNQISTVDKTSFQNLSTITLDLAGNNLSDLPSDLFVSLEKLTTLDLSGNLISLLPKGVFNPLVSLEKVDLTGNLLTEISALDVGLNGKAQVTGVEVK